MSRRAKRLAIAGLGLLGVADLLYMLAYEERLIDHLVCPFFGDGCDRVGRSDHASHLGVPHAAAGAVAYAAMATLALWGGADPPEQRRWQNLLLGAMSGAAAGASLFLIYEQKAKVKHWCFWCLLASGINFAIAPMALPDARRAARSARRQFARAA